MSETAPKILDAKGRPLSVGSRVERVFPNGTTGGMVGEIDAVEPDGSVWVTWNRRIQLRSIFDGRRRFSLRRSYRCDDLNLTDQYDKEESRGD